MQRTETGKNDGEGTRLTNLVGTKLVGYRVDSDTNPFLLVGVLPFYQIEDGRVLDFSQDDGHGSLTKYLISYERFNELVENGEGKKLETPFDFREGYELFVREGDVFYLSSKEADEKIIDYSKEFLERARQEFEKGEYECALEIAKSIVELGYIPGEQACRQRDALKIGRDCFVALKKPEGWVERVEGDIRDLEEKISRDEETSSLKNQKS